MHTWLAPVRMLSQRWDTLQLFAETPKRVDASSPLSHVRKFEKKIMVAQVGPLDVRPNIAKVHFAHSLCMGQRSPKTRWILN